eukprot:TRINITY_DN12400_c0_g1_i1.p1 TRINITY_DN12400_c0_g1~~TRINITY_DN12400_c0_g1_i1.p1  ORF type:complete len:260 (+),score=36.67 TRINITY_DN12400_c0_g1_i1:43-822(+)
MRRVQKLLPRLSSSNILHLSLTTLDSGWTTVPFIRTAGSMAAVDAANLPAAENGSEAASNGESDASSRRYKIYTKTGDKGTSSLYNGERRRKDDDVFEALGDVDELNSALGLAREHCVQQKLEDLCEQLAEVQSRLLDVGSAVATPLDTSGTHKVKRVEFDGESIARVEGWVDAMEETLPPLTNFILPSGGLAASQLHVSRSVCRRAERRIVPLVLEGKVDAAVGRYMNRLSDWLFVAARVAAKRGGWVETIYVKTRAK